MPQYPANTPLSRGSLDKRCWSIWRSMMSADYHDVPLTATATHEPYAVESDVQRAENPFAWALRFGQVPEGTKRGF